jgi:hypothetical protein
LAAAPLPSPSSLKEQNFEVPDYLVRTIVRVSPAPLGSLSQMQQQVAVALGKLEQTRQAGLKQAWDAARQQQALAWAFAGWEQRRQDGLQQSWALEHGSRGGPVPLSQLWKKVNGGVAELPVRAHMGGVQKGLTGKVVPEHGGRRVRLAS